MKELELFRQECAKEIAGQSVDKELQTKTRDWLDAANSHKYSYHFEWLGRPIIQFPQDIVGLQELIWTVKPDLIVETGIAHGGSLIFSASMLALLDLCESMEGGRRGVEQLKRRVVGLDIDIRSHNREAITSHPLASQIEMIEGSSIDAEIVLQVSEIARQHERVLVCLDSNHTHDHVLAELEAYAPIVSPGSYCVVFDTIVEDMPENSFPDRPWGQGNNPKTAVWEFLKTHAEFETDKHMENKLLITVAPDGFLRRLPN